MFTESYSHFLILIIISCTVFAGAPTSQPVTPQASPCQPVTQHAVISKPVTQQPSQSTPKLLPVDPPPLLRGSPSDIASRGRGRTSTQATTGGNDGPCKAPLSGAKVGSAGRPGSAGRKPAAAIAAAATARASRIKSPLPHSLEAEEKGRTSPLDEQAAPVSAINSTSASLISPKDQTVPAVNVCADLKPNSCNEQKVEPLEELAYSERRAEVGEGSGGDSETGVGEDNNERSESEMKVCSNENYNDDVTPAPALKRSDTFTFSDNES